MFQKMMDIVLRAVDKIKLPCCTAVCELIIKKIKIDFISLKKNCQYVLDAHRCSLIIYVTHNRARMD